MKKAIISILILTFLLSGIVSAYEYSTINFKTTTIFKEDISGENRGFSLTQTTSIPRNSLGCDYYDWSSDARFCQKTLRLTGKPQINFYQINNNQDIQKEAFKTFQRDSQDQSRFELEKLKLRYSYRPYRRFYW